MSGDGDPFPHLLNANAIARVGSGKYRAVAISSVVTITVTEIPMSGISTRAELVHIPTFAPPIRYKLMVWETLPELDNLILGSTSAFFSSSQDQKTEIVQIEDASGIHDVHIESDKSSISINTVSFPADHIYEGVGNNLDQAVKNVMNKLPVPAGADMISTLTVTDWGFRSGGFVGLSEFWVKGKIT